MLDPKFTFSQTTLQDFVDCERRFELAYIDQLRWPALQTEPALAFEHLAELGAQFHRMVEQFQLGLPEELIARQVSDPKLQSWWDAWQRLRPQGLPTQQYVEVKLATRVAGHTLVAQYDLVAIAPGEKVVIIDWKTSERRPKQETLASRLQTRIYPYVLAKAGQTFTNGTPIDPAQIEMIYWYPNVPEHPAQFRYSQAQFDADELYLSELINHAASKQHGMFNLTTNEQRCKFCQYRSLCNRGVQAGHVSELEADASDTLDLQLDLDSITAIDFE